jgi:hypothetical protein
MTYKRKLETPHTDCQHYWMENYITTSPAEMRDVIIDLLETIWEMQANMDSMKVELEDARDQYFKSNTDVNLLATIDTTIDYLDGQAQELYSINL